MKILLMFAVLLSALHFSNETAIAQQIKIYSAEQNKFIAVNKIVQTEKQWKKQLPAKVFDVARKQGTERAFSGKYHDNHEKGIYQCYCCGTDLFSSDHKFDSGTGWPSFYTPKKKKNVTFIRDEPYGSKMCTMRCSLRSCV